MNLPLSHSNRAPLSPRSNRLAVGVATFGYIGFFPFAPGTVGSAAGLLLYGLLRLSASPAIELAVIAGLFLVGVWSGTAAERHFGGEDPGPVVIDEVVGMLVTLAFLPTSYTVAVTGFFVFRIFDVFKPFPAGRMERLPGGLGVMADDLMAAVYGNMVVRLAVWFVPGWVL
jgi:phosphatidylglycerophosphatase A